MTKRNHSIFLFKKNWMSCLEKTQYSILEFHQHLLSCTLHQILRILKSAQFSWTIWKLPTTCMEKNPCSHSLTCWQRFHTQFKSTMKIKTRPITQRMFFRKWWRFLTKTLKLKTGINTSSLHQLFWELCFSSSKCMSRHICFSQEPWINSFDMSKRKKTIPSWNKLMSI